MPVRQSSASSNAENVPEVAVPIAAIVEETIVAPISHINEIAEFIDTWVQAQRGIEPEVLGTFKFVAQQNGWIADTPSGWQAKFARWLVNG